MLTSISYRNGMRIGLFCVSPSKTSAPTRYVIFPEATADRRNFVTTDNTIQPKKLVFSDSLPYYEEVGLARPSIMRQTL